MRGADAQAPVDGEERLKVASPERVGEAVPIGVLGGRVEPGRGKPDAKTTGRRGERGSLKDGVFVPVQDQPHVARVHAVEHKLVDLLRVAARQEDRLAPWGVLRDADIEIDGRERIPRRRIHNSLG